MYRSKFSVLTCTACRQSTDSVSWARRPNDKGRAVHDLCSATNPTNKAGRMLSRMTTVGSLVIAVAIITASTVWAHDPHKDLSDCITILSQINRASSAGDDNEIQVVMRRAIRDVHSTDQLTRLALASWSLSISEAGDERVLGYFRTAFWSCIYELCDRRDKGDAGAAHTLVYIRQGLPLADGGLLLFDLKVDHRSPYGHGSP